jgi:hypothetical protein
MKDDLLTPRPTRRFVCLPFVTVEILVADLRVRKVEDPVGLLATRVNARRALLDKLARAAVHVVRQHALLPVRHRVVEQETLRTEHLLRHALLADVELVALLRVRELSVILRALVVGRGDALQGLPVRGGPQEGQQQECLEPALLLLLGRHAGEV